MVCLDSFSVGKIRAAFSANRHEKVRTKLAQVKLSLPAAIEIAAWLADTAHNDEVGRAILQEIKHPAVASASNLFYSPKEQDVVITTIHGVAEMRQITYLDSADRCWIDFIMRFQDALTRASFDKAYARALSYALHEMADNVVQHATEHPSQHVRSIAGWHVCEDTAVFSVVDLGRGIQASLKSSSAWTNLRTDRDALLAVVRDRATRKAENKIGDGYNHLVRNFVSRNGCLALRSGDCEIEAKGDIASGSVRTMTQPWFGGARIAAWCAPRSPTLPPQPIL